MGALLSQRAQGCAIDMGSDLDLHAASAEEAGAGGVQDRGHLCPPVKIRIKARLMALQQAEKDSACLQASKSSGMRWRSDAMVEPGSLPA